MNGRVNKVRFYDRFIPRRTGIDIEALNYVLLKDNTVTSIESESYNDENTKFRNKAYAKWQKKMFQERLDSQTSIPKKLLNFSQGRLKFRITSPDCELWPVRARKKPLIGSPKMVLDMPHLEGDICQQNTDWGSTGYIVSVFTGEVFLWNPQGDSTNVVTRTGGIVGKCLRWNKNGTVFALSYDMKGIALFDFKEKKIVQEARCLCALMCSITAMQWTNSNLLITGCSLGRVSVWSKELQYLYGRLYAHDGIVITVSLSCSERYVATSGEDNNVRVWYWPELNEHFEVSYVAPVRGLAWHPWNPSLLAIGGGVGDACITIWNAASIEQRGYKPPSDNNALSVDSLTWSPLTGELVVSYWQHGRSTNNIDEGKSIIIVLANLTKEVDAIEWHDGRVLYLLWGEDGAILATAGTDENMCMWDFLGNSSETLKKHKRNRKRIRTSDVFETAKKFGYCIR